MISKTAFQPFSPNPLTSGALGFAKIYLLAARSLTMPYFLIASIIVAGELKPARKSTYACRTSKDIGHDLLKSSCGTSPNPALTSVASSFATSCLSGSRGETSMRTANVMSFCSMLQYTLVAMPSNTDSSFRHKLTSSPIRGKYSICLLADTSSISDFST